MANTGLRQEPVYKNIYPCKFQVVNIDELDLTGQSFDQVMRNIGITTSTDTVYLVISKQTNRQIVKLGDYNAQDYILRTCLVVNTQLDTGKGNTWAQSYFSNSRNNDLNNFDPANSGQVLRFKIEDLLFDFCGLNSNHNYVKITNFVNDHRADPNTVPVGAAVINQKSRWYTYMQYDVDAEDLVDSYRLQAIIDIARLGVRNVNLEVHTTFSFALIKDYSTISGFIPPAVQQNLGELLNTDPNVDALGPAEDGHELYWDNAANHWSHRAPPASGSRGFEYVFRTGLVVPAAGEVAYNNVALDTLRINKTDNQGISRAFYITPNINGSWEFQDNDPTTDNFFKISRKSEPTFDAGTYLEWNNLTGTNLTLSDGDIVYLTIDNAGAQILNELDDVTITKVADQNILVYQQGTGQWQNQALPPTSETGSTVSAVFIPGSLPANNEFDLNFATGLFRLNQNNLFGTPQTYRRPSLGDLIHLTQQNGQGEMVVLRVTTDPILIGQYWEMTTNILKDDVFSSVVDNYTLLIVKESVDQYIEITDPLVTSDINGGYVVGDQWLNTTTDTVFICVDNTAGAAVWINISTGGIGRVGHPYNITDVVPNPPTIEFPSGTVNLDDDTLYISSFDAKGVDISQILNFAVTNQSIIQWFFNADSTKYFYVKVEPATLTFVPGVVEPGWFQGTVTVGEEKGAPVLDDEGTVLFNPVQHTELGQIGDVSLGVGAFQPVTGDQLTYTNAGEWSNLTNILGSIFFTGTNTTTIGAINTWTKIAGAYTLGANSFQLQLGTGAPAPLNSLQSIDGFDWQVEIKYFATLASGTNNQDISLSVYKDGVIISESILETSLVNAGRPQTVTGVIWNTVTLNSYFELYVRNVSGANNIDVTNSHLFINAIRLI